MKYTLEDIAKHLGAEIIWPNNSPAVKIEIDGVAGIEQAISGQISIIKNPLAFSRLKNISQASAFLSGEIIKTDRPLIKVKNINFSFAKLLELFYPRKKKSAQIDPRAVIGENVKMGANVSLAPNVFLGDRVSIGNNVCLYPNVYVGDDSRIGDNCLIYPNVTIYERISIGKNVIIHSGTVIGSDGFGFTPAPDGTHYKIPQVGIVIIEDDVEIGANCCIDRATLEVTIIKRGTKLDNLVQIAHNVTIGEDSVLAAQVGIAGSSHLGKKVSLGGQVGVADHVHIADQTMLVGQSGVIGDLKSGIYAGMPARDYKLWQKAQAAILHLPELIKEFREIKKKIKP